MEMYIRAIQAACDREFCKTSLNKFDKEFLQFPAMMWNFWMTCED